MSDLLWWNLLVIIIDVILFSVFDTVEQYAPGFKQSIVGTDILTPPDLEEVFNLTGGVSWNCYRPQRSCGKVMFSQASVILFTGGGGRTCYARATPWARTRGRYAYYWIAILLDSVYTLVYPQPLTAN